MRSSDSADPDQGVRSSDESPPQSPPSLPSVLRSGQAGGEGVVASRQNLHPDAVLSDLELETVQVVNRLRINPQSAEFSDAIREQLQHFEGSVMRRTSCIVFLCVRACVRVETVLCSSDSFAKWWMVKLAAWIVSRHESSHVRPVTPPMIMNA